MIDHDKIRKFLKKASGCLRGDWVVIGGAVLPALGIETRITYDIDLCGPEDATQEQTLALMSLAEELDLPVEAINQAGAFFLHRIDDWETQLVTLFEGEHATFYRPNPTLFILLKISRLSSSDLADCLDMIAYARRHDEDIDIDRLKHAIQKAPTSPEKAPRLTRLLRALTN